VWFTLQADGGLQEHKIIERQGTFEKTKTTVTMHWSDPLGPGGETWMAHIRHRAIVVSIGGATTEYQFAPAFFKGLVL